MVLSCAVMRAAEARGFDSSFIAWNFIDAATFPARNFTFFWEKYFVPTFHIFLPKYAKNKMKSINYKQYFIQTVRKVPVRPHEGPRTIVQSFGEKHFNHISPF